MYTMKNIKITTQDSQQKSFQYTYLQLESTKSTVPLKVADRNMSTEKDL